MVELTKLSRQSSQPLWAQLTYVGGCPATLLQQLKQWHLVARLPKQQSENSKSIDLLSTENKVSSAEILRELGYFLLRAQFQR